MIDPLVERRYAECRELLELWRSYHDFFKVAVAGESLTADREHEFITVKSRIAMLHDTFMDCLDRDQNIGQNILSIVTRSITLKHVHRLSTAEIKKIELEWHESYLLLNETLGILDDKRKRFATVTPSQYYRQVYTKKAVATIHNFLASMAFKTAAVLVILMVGVFVFLQFGGLDKMFNWGPTRNLVIKFEDLIRMVAKDYPYREISSWTRLDTLVPSLLEPPQFPQPTGPYSPNAGMTRVGEKMAGSQYNIANDLKGYQQNQFRVEVYRPAMGSPLGGGECVVFLYLMPTSAAADAIAKKYAAWYNEQTTATKDWEFFRKGNAIGLSFAGDPDGWIRKWARNQYLRIREKRR